MSLNQASAQPPNPSSSTSPETAETTEAGLPPESLATRETSRAEGYHSPGETNRDDCGGDSWESLSSTSSTYSSSWGSYSDHSPDDGDSSSQSPPFRPKSSPEGLQASSTSLANGSPGRITFHEEFDLDGAESEPEVVQHAFEDPSSGYSGPWWKPLPKWAFIRSSTSLPMFHLEPDNLLHGSSKLRYEVAVEVKTGSEDGGHEWWEDESGGLEIAKEGAFHF
ncbi:hypothetical protein VM1G_11314 [Cytospora mali]|uniref:Uncharacterized protein n=1 Tax=Cytospora mali TaxID=578113 RepID=A0A194VPB6_CYTMA|nr:hypothetical protein VM1G_11314 [Valsa mali]